MIIIKIIGFIFITIGLIVSVLDKFMCTCLCSTCTNQQLNPCFFLFLFVGIIFFVAGYVLIIMKQQTQLPKVKFKDN